MISMEAHISFHGNTFHKQLYNFTTVSNKRRLLEQAVIKVKITKREREETLEEVALR